MISVASVPSSHPYVAAVAGGYESSGVRLLPDPVPFDGAAPGQWWPPQWLDPAFLRERVSTIDVLHVHFGFDEATVGQLSTVVEILRTHAVPLVLTVHDLHNPHFVDSTVHRRQLDVLVRAADEVITLTLGAAHEIERTWQRSAVVLPHPHVLPLELLPAREHRNPQPVIGIHAKNLRSNMDPEAVIPTVIEAAGTLGAVVRIDVDDALFDDTSHWYAPDAATRLLAYSEHPGVDVRMHPRFTDEELWTYLGDIDVAVLPYRFGTHSGWMEACRDAGVRVVVPDTGYFSEQFACESFAFGVDRFDPSTLVDALDRAIAAPDQDSLRHNHFRREQVLTLARSHGDLYQRVHTGLAGAA